MKLHRAILPFVLVFHSFSAQARIATPDDAGYMLDSRTIEVEVRKDGRYTLTYDERMLVLKDGRKEEIGTRRIPYNSKASKLEILDAEVKNGDHTMKVDHQYIEDKPLVSPEEGFDDRNQVTIAFPDIHEGSVMHMKYRLTLDEVPFPGHFSERFLFGAGFFEKTSEVKVISELPLYSETNDPLSVLEVQSGDPTKKKDRYEVRIHLKKPLYFDPVNEHKPYVDMQSQTWVVVSTQTEYADLVKITGPTYEKILSKPLPDTFLKIIEQAKAEKTPTDQANRVTTLLAERIRYTGDWRPIRGGLIPRDLKVIDETRFGDCKDMATSTTAMLRVLGFDAHVAWVERGSVPTAFPKLALSGVFNHAIVRASKNGEKFWIDPTNLQSFAQGVFEDIAERRALVVDLENPRLESISVGGPSSSVAFAHREVSFLSGGRMQTTAQLQLKGRASVEVTGAVLRYSKSMLEYGLATSVARPSNLISYEVAPYDLSSRLVKDLQLRLKVLEKRSSYLTSAGPLYTLPVEGLVSDLLTIDLKDRISGFFLGPPQTRKRVTELERVGLVGKLPPKCSIDTPWISLSREFKTSRSGVEITDLLVTKQMALLNIELKSDAFAEFQKKLKQCFDLIGITYRP